MFFQEDWIMRQITMMVQVIARMLNKEEIFYSVSGQATYVHTDMLHARLMELLMDGYINEAENFLFENIRMGHSEDLWVAADFYERLNAMSDTYLQAHDFSRDELKAGLEEIMALYGVGLMPSP